jgi:aspartyl-tRNA(Asn)/glutamyl-tRNA(Gln) amidotransferase subunit A
VANSPFLSVIDLVQAIRSHEVTCQEVTEQYLDRARRAQAEFNCFIDIGAESAVRDARLLDEQLAHGHQPGELTGVPFAAKDIFVHGGHKPTIGSRRVRLQTRERFSPALERLEQAGAVGLGWLNLDQFSYAATGTNPDFGSVLNPWDPTRMAGGSSSGAAAAVACGALPFAVGADTGGSVRIPASFCGVVGLKPTFGRIPRRGAAPMCYSQDSLGILAGSATDVALVLDVMAGYDPLDPSSFEVPVAPYAEAVADGADGMRGLRLGVDESYMAGIGGAEVQAAIHRALEDMDAHGAELVPINLSRLAVYDVVAAVITWAEVGALHSQTFPRFRDVYAPATRARLDSALLSHGADHVNAVRFQGKALREFLRDVLSRVDVVVNPTTAGPPALVRDVEEDDRRGIVNRSLDSLQLSRPFNLLGLPAMSIPMGFDECGLPMGLHLVSRPWDESTLLRCAAAYQQVTDWHLRAPPTAVASPSRSASPEPGRAISSSSPQVGPGAA